MSNPWVFFLVTAGLISLSAFFVAVEFALLAARRHRLEDAAPTSRAARAALRSAGELTVLLAGSQLGITLCTLALGATTEPALHHWLTPLFETWGVPAWIADVSGFVLALVLVTFLHLVVGEMAPKSWAIAHPEKSATLLSLPMRAFMWLTRPALVALNEMANWLLVKVGVEPVDEMSTGQDPDDLRHLVEHSANVGALDVRYSTQLAGALEMRTFSVRDMVDRRTAPTAVPSGSTLADVQAASRESGHLRILVQDGDTVQGVVHVRDTLVEPVDRPVTELMRPPYTLEANTSVYAALAAMRETRNHLAVVQEEKNVAGVITLADVLGRLFPAVERSA